MKNINKKFIMLFFIIILSSTIQTVVLYYLDKFYFTNNTQFTFKEIPLKSKSQPNIETKIDGNAENITMSPSGKYCSYNLGKNLNIVNLIDGTKIALNLDKDLDNYYFKWNTTEDKMIISEKTEEFNGSGIKIYTYNPKTNSKQESLNYNNESQTYTLPTSNVKIDGIELNTMNTIMYLKISNNNKSYIERLDISSGLSQINVNTNRIGRFFVVKQRDEVIYENLNVNNIYITDKSENKKIDIPGYQKLKLLNIDKNDAVFIGALENNMVTKVFKKNFDESSEKTTWDSINLETPVLPENLYILNSGKVYVIDNLRGTATNIEDKTKIIFRGSFISINDRQILSSSDENLIITPLK